MNIYIAILRAINVSGKNKINIAELKKMFEDMNFKNVTTYIQSGNVVFESKKTDYKKLEKLIETKILERFTLQIPVIVRDKNELTSIIKSNPFLKRKNIDVTKLHATLLANEPEQTNIGKLKNVHYEPDEFILSGREIYVYCPNGYGTTKINNNFFENKLKVTATTRNWKTMNELLSIAENISK